jgi:carbon monoxide dehydrogenase subunit G
MPWFSASTQSTAVVSASRDGVWKTLTDPGVVASLTPLVRDITASGDVWCWQMARVPVLGLSVTPAFTEQMTFTDGFRIEYAHAPPAGSTERAGADGWYELSDADGGGTALAISLTVKAELPVPRAAGPAVRAAMSGVMATMGAGFSRNLLKHLDAG